LTRTLLTTVEVAERLGLSSAAVAQAVRTGALLPTARTNDDFLFTERAVAAFAEQRTQALASPLETPAAGSRGEWSGDVDRLNLWLKEMTEALRPAQADATSQQPAVLAPLIEAPAIDFRPPAPGPVSTLPEPSPAPEDAVEAAPEPDRAPVLPEAEPAAALEAPEQVAEARAPQVPPPVDELEPVAPAGESAPVGKPEPLPGPGCALSKQAVLVVQPVVRFRVLRDVMGRLASIPGVADARLERLEGGVASYRISFEGERPADQAFAEALASLNLVVILVDSIL
jgi:hypothetical protein